MRVVCAWCGKEIKTKESLEDEEISQGLCLDCYARETGKIERVEAICGSFDKNKR